MRRSRPLVLVVDDEPQIRRFLRTSLPANGFDVLEAENASAALRMIGHDKPDVVVLDLGLPDQDGQDVILTIRRTSPVPILVLSSRGDTTAKVKALENGADDYVTKPFDMEELIARLRTALRHRFQEEGATPALKVGTIEVDLVRRIVTREKAEVHLSPKEYDLLAYLIRHAGKVVTHKQLLREIWGTANEDDIQYLRGYMRQLRQKLERDPQRPEFLQTETGIGYRLKPDATP